MTAQRRILAALYHSYVDTSSGAAISLRHMLEALARRNWQVRVFSGPLLDFETGPTNQQLLEDQGNPQPHKGVFIVARIAEILGRERPDIPFLVVESRAASHWINLANPALAEAQNLFRMNNTPDPRDYYRASRVVLMPSVWQESFGRVAAEAMINGIPVLGSTRGALPEVIAQDELLIEVPERCTPESRDLPSAKEVRPWVDAIQRLWDDESYYRELSNRCRRRAAVWTPERLVTDFERAILPSPL